MAAPIGRPLALAGILCVTVEILAATSVGAQAHCGVPGSGACPQGGDSGKVPTRTPFPSETAIAIQPLLSLATPATGTPTLTLDQQLQAYGAQTATAVSAMATGTPGATATAIESTIPSSPSPTITTASTVDLGAQSTAGPPVAALIVGLVILGVLTATWLSRRSKNPPGPPNPRV